MNEIENILIEKIGDKKFKRAKLLAENKFGQKRYLIEKYYKSMIDDYISIDDEWANEDTIDIITSKIEKLDISEKINIINDIISTYDIKDGKTKYILEKYQRALKKLV